MKEEQCKHHRLTNFYIGKEIAPYQCQSCKKISLVIRKPEGEEVVYHPLEVYLKAMKDLESKAEK